MQNVPSSHSPFREREKASFTFYSRPSARTFVEEGLRFAERCSADCLEDSVHIISAGTVVNFYSN